MTKTHKTLSSIRKELWNTYRQVGRVLRTLQNLNEMTPGSLYLHRRCCGKATCRCTRGQLHSSWVVTRSEGGKIRLYTVDDRERAQVRAWTGQYRIYQRGRARLAKLTTTLLAGVDEVVEVQRQVWPKVQSKEDVP